MPIAFKVCDDLALTCDALLGFDDVPFSLSQVFLPDGAIHRTSGHSLSRKTKSPARPEPAGDPLAIPRGWGVGEGMPAAQLTTPSENTRIAPKHI
jgi:hypothetical protein